MAAHSFCNRIISYFSTVEFKVCVVTTYICQVEVSSFSWLHSGQEDNLLNAVLMEESQEFIPVDGFCFLGFFFCSCFKKWTFFSQMPFSVVLAV